MREWIETTLSLATVWIVATAAFAVLAERWLFKSRDEEDGEAWPWCDACQSYHHPRNPTCVAREEDHRA